MALKFHPAPGTFLVCDYRGYIKPEMVKRRPVVVISPRFRRREGLCTVVPLSCTAPDPIMSYHVLLELRQPLNNRWNAIRVWAKCDMVTVASFASFERLDLVRIGRRQDGRRIYNYDRLDDHQLLAIRKGVAASIGLLTSAP